MSEALFQDPMSVDVAGVYHPALAPVGLLMAVVGYVLGIYGTLAAVWPLGQVGGA